jgi:hypothetical protein
MRHALVRALTPDVPGILGDTTNPDIRTGRPMADCTHDSLKVSAPKSVKHGKTFAVRARGHSNGRNHLYAKATAKLKVT